MKICVDRWLLHAMPLSTARGARRAGSRTREGLRADSARLWVSEQLGRPVVKAWNAIDTHSFNTRNTVSGTPGRLAIPVAGDSEAARAVGLALVDETGSTVSTPAP